MRRDEALLLALLLVAYLAMAGLYATQTPVWQAPDEPAHYNYVRQLAEGELPVIEPGDYDQDYIGVVVSSRFDPAYSVRPLTYEDWQPPLYYALQAPVYRLANGSPVAMRLLSVLLGAGVVVLAYFVARQVFGGRVAPALAATAFVAFLPQHLAMIGSINNDSLAELLIAGLLLLMVAPWPDERDAGRLLSLGVLLGLGFLTKGTVYLMAPVVGLFLLAEYWQRWRPLVRALALTFIPALVFGGLLWARNSVVYGGLDFLARGAHDAVVVGQPRTSEWIALYGGAETARRFMQSTFNSFWGQFGWMAAPLPAWMYVPLAIVVGIAVVGLALVLFAHRRDRDFPWRSAGVLGLTFVLTAAVHVGYNLTFVQHQGRYLFPALIPIAIGLVAGLRYWLRPLARRWSRVEWLLPVGVVAVLLPLATFALYRVIVPVLSPP